MFRQGVIHIHTVLILNWSWNIFLVIADHRLCDFPELQYPYLFACGNSIWEPFNSAFLGSFGLNSENWRRSSNFGFGSRYPKPHIASSQYAMTDMYGRQLLPGVDRAVQTNGKLKQFNQYYSYPKASMQQPRNWDQMRGQLD